MKRLNAKGKTARHGLQASPYTKTNKKPARYADYPPLDPDFYRSASHDAKGHPGRVQRREVKQR